MDFDNAAVGPSPRVRGNLAFFVDTADLAGPIPACAGQPSRSARAFMVFWAHPRVCGATLCASRNAFALVGPSPRVRGNRANPDGKSVAEGPIPACAGQPVAEIRAVTVARAHPRVCGATAVAPLVIELGQGPSPRVRGNQPCAGRGSWVSGPIPACAGQPSQPFARWRWIGAHPRVCGATVPTLMANRLQKGPSPRVRGNRLPRFEQ